MAVMTWLELSVEVDAEAAEPVSEVLAQYGYNGGVAIDQPITPSVDSPEYAYDTSRPVTVRTYIPLDERAEEIQMRLQHTLWHLGQMRPIGPLIVRQLEEQDWAEAWKQYYTIQRVGERTVIVPSWLTYEPQPGDIVLRLDPGMAFGTGLHPTTQLCIMFLEQHMQPGVRAIDLGCGSGILAITAARLGAAAVLALDTDPIAVAATRENAARNDVAAIVQVAEGSLGGGATLGHWLGWENTGEAEASKMDVRVPPSAAGYNLIVANIIARVLAALAHDLTAVLAPGGIVISSGIIAEREAEVAAAYAAAGLTRLDRRREGDWVALVHKRVVVS